MRRRLAPVLALCALLAAPAAAADTGVGVCVLGVNFHANQSGVGGFFVGVVLMSGQFFGLEFNEAEYMADCGATYAVSLP